MSMRDRLRGARPAPAACAALCVAMGGRRAGCWRRRGSAPRAGDDGPPRSSVRPTRHSPPHGDIADADVAAAAAGRAARFSYGVIAKHAALNDQQFSGGRLTRLALNPRAREGRADPSPSVAERPAIRPTRWRRLLAAVANFFREIPVRANADDDVVVAAAAGGRAAPWTAMSMRDRLAGCATCASRLCGAVCGNGRSPRGMLAAPRISAARRRRRATAQQRATNTTLAATRRHR